MVRNTLKAVEQAFAGSLTCKVQPLHYSQLRKSKNTTEGTECDLPWHRPRSGT
jgi:hypothetical protein